MPLLLDSATVVTGRYLITKFSTKTVVAGSVKLSRNIMPMAKMHMQWDGTCLSLPKTFVFIFLLSLYYSVMGYSDKSNNFQHFLKYLILSPGLLLHIVITSARTFGYLKNRVPVGIELGTRVPAWKLLCGCYLLANIAT